MSNILMESDDLVRTIAEVAGKYDVGYSEAEEMVSTSIMYGIDLEDSKKLLGFKEIDTMAIVGLMKACKHSCEEAINTIRSMQRIVKEREDNDISA